MKIRYFLINLLLGIVAWGQVLVIPQTQIDANEPIQSQALSNAHVKVISKSAIKASGAENLQQVLQGVVGVQVNDLFGNGSEISVGIRGFGANASQNSLILINGVPLVNPDLAAPNLDIIPVNAIQRIVIFNGSEGALYGDQAVGGVVNIITKKPKQAALYGSLTFGSYNTSIFKEGFSLYNQKHNLYADVNVRKYSTDNYRQHNQDKIQQAYGDIGQQSLNSGWNVYYNLNHQDLQFAGALTAMQVKQNRRQAQNLNNFANSNVQYIQLTQHHALNLNWQEDFKAAYRNLNSNGFLFNDFQSDQRENWLQLQFKGLIGSILSNNGLVFTHENYDLVNGNFHIFSKQHRWALFSVESIPIKNRFNLILGARSAWQQAFLNTKENSSSQQSVLVTTLGLSYRWYNWLHLFIRRAGNFRFPKADENANTQNGIGGLKVQKGVSYEIGAKFNHKRWYGTLSAFDLLIHNEIAFDPTSTPLQPFGSNRNLSPTQRLGILFNINFHVTKRLLIGGQYTHITATFLRGEFAGNRIPFVANNLFSLYENYRFANHWILYSQLLFTGQRYATGDDRNQFSELPSFTIINLALGYHRDNFFVKFRVNNIFNIRYNAFASVTTINLNPVQRQEFFYPAPGRNVLITAGFKL